MKRSDVKHFMKTALINNVIFRLWFRCVSKRDPSSLQVCAAPGESSPEEALRKIYQPPLRRTPVTGYRFNAEVELSVVLPVYNVEDYLEECLHALLMPEVGMSYEVLAVNDGSTDSSRHILSKWREENSGVLRIIDRENGGLSAARNTGLLETRGRYVTFVDSDDVIDIHGICDAVMHLKASDADYASGLYRRIDDEGHPFGKTRRVSSLMVPWGRVYKREVWRDVRFPEGYWYEDLVMPYLIESRFKGLEAEPLRYLYRDRPGSIVNSTVGNPKGLDSFWLIGYMLDECKRLHIPYERVLGTTLVAMGPTLLNRSTALDQNQMQHLFRACCNLIRPIEAFRSPCYEMGKYHETLRKSLLVGDYKAWCASCLAIALEGDTGGAKRALKLLRADR